MPRRARLQDKMEKIKVYIENNQKDVKIPTGIRLLIRRCCSAVIKEEGIEKQVEVGVTFVNNAEIKEMNAGYRSKDIETDVLSFPQFENGDLSAAPEGVPVALGDIVISLQKAEEQAEKFGHSFQREVAFLTVHSMLHLLGYDHEDGGIAQVRMREKEETVLLKLGLNRDESYVFENL